MKSLQFRYKSLDMKKIYHYFAPGKSNGYPNRKTDINLWFRQKTTFRQICDQQWIASFSQMKKQ